jgi:TRAP-type mannitol/chloroaromatic compound transport system substrate-binding protein
MLAEYTARNPAALQTLLDKHGVDMRPFPDDVIAKLKQLSGEVVSEIAQKDEFSQKVFASYQKFLEQSAKWSSISELAYLKARDQG